MNWIILICYILTLASIRVLSKQYESCLKYLPEIKAKRYPYYKNAPITIKIDTSERITHQLSSHAFRIFALEILGYPRVEISHYEDHFDVTENVDRLSDKENLTIPLSTINLEVWVPPDYDTIQLESRTNVEDCGNAAANGGRFGWFIPRDMIDPIKRFYKQWYEDMTEVSWTFFRNPRASSYFDVNDPNDLDFIKKNRDERNNCTDCIDGIYIPEWCRNESCALLLSSDYHSTNFVVKHITELKLYVKVVWLGINLDKVANRLKDHYKATDENKSLLILTWTPSVLVSNVKQFVSVAFKKCELMSSTPGIGCKYETNRLAKFSWTGLQDFGKPLLDAVKQYTYHNNDYGILLDIYKQDPSMGVEAAACQWMRTYNYTWLEWKPILESTIYIGGIFPMHNSPFVGEGIAMAAKMAEIAINENNSILTDYKLEVLMSDGQCRSDLVMKMFIDYVVNKQFQSLIGVLGPACSDTVEPLASVSKHYQTMIISYSAEGASFSDRDRYPYFFRTIGENRHYTHVYVKFLKYMGWKQVAALTEDGQKYTEYISRMQSLLEDNQITFISNIKFTRDQESTVMSKYLEDLKRKRARIIIADVVNEVAKLIMCEAYKLKMTAREGYVWFLPTSYNTIQGGRINCTVKEMSEAANGYFSMAHAYYGKDDSIMQENMTVREWREKYRRMTRKMSNYAGYAYDAVWTYALATDKLAKTDPEALSHIHSNTTIKKLEEIINDTDFMGVSGRIKFRGGPSRFSVINILQWYDNESHVVGQFHPNLSDDKPEILGGRLQINASLIKWFTRDGRKPSDGKLPPEVCALNGLAKFFNVDCSMAIVILNVMIISTVVILVALVVYKIKRRYEEKAQETEDYLKSLGLDWESIDGIRDLSEYELTSQQYWINRRIGSGHFGQVYGGEALLREGDCWVPIAVKILKKESTNDLKIDFLTEADVMRRFDHTNVVKLLGVKMAEEPLHIIMEFMLYGDLENYLLGRRHLVAEDSDEVSSERLTSMALDIARGLSYLAECRFVHRDLAARNCFVNSNLSVKIGDFGMCRPMPTKDYQHLCQRDKDIARPVKWMSPEAMDGIFTGASDVWSYGIVLYEMVTFGGCPYPGMTNERVKDHVKAGRSPAVPKGVKPQLEALMRACWSCPKETRPQAKEIVAYIAGYKELLTPCLDNPVPSIPIDFSEERSELRKCSTPTSKNFPPILSNGNLPLSVLGIDVPRVRRQMSVPENCVNIPMETYCARQPLLSMLQEPPYAKYVPKQHISNDSGVQEDDYVPASMLMNGHAMNTAR